jgi:hypothetical protein
MPVLAVGSSGIYLDKVGCKPGKESIRNVKIKLCTVTAICETLSSATNRIITAEVNKSNIICDFVPRNEKNRHT